MAVAVYMSIITLSTASNNTTNEGVDLSVKTVTNYPAQHVCEKLLYDGYVSYLKTSCDLGPIIFMA